VVKKLNSISLFYKILDKLLYRGVVNCYFIHSFKIPLQITKKTSVDMYFVDKLLLDEGVKWN